VYLPVRDIRKTRNDEHRGEGRALFWSEELVVEMCVTEGYVRREDLGGNEGIQSINPEPVMIIDVT
jgi:hypothetical protein